MRRLQQLIYPLIFCSLLSINKLYAQEYKYEVGAMTGVSFYMGDANQETLYRNSWPAGGILFRINKNFRWAIKNNLVIGHLSGNSKYSGSVYPYGQTSSFSRTFYELGSQIEFNFFNYSNSYNYVGTKRFTPYIFTGLGFTLASGDKTFFDANIPLGVGLKYKLRERLNIGFEFSFRRLFSDNLDVTNRGNGFNLNDPYGIKSSGSKNKDWYSLTLISISWDFGLRCNPCFNE